MRVWSNLQKRGGLFVYVKVKMFYDGLGRTNTQKGLAPFKTAYMHTGSNPTPRAIPKGSEELVFEEFSFKACVLAEISVFECFLMLIHSHPWFKPDLFRKYYQFSCISMLSV